MIKDTSKRKSGNRRDSDRRHENIPVKEERRKGNRRNSVDRRQTRT